MIKKVTFQNSKNLTLVGSLWQNPTDAIIIMAHGAGSNRFSRGLFEQLAASLQTEGYNVLAFDFSGHGESDDDIVTLKQSTDDVSSAIAFAKKLGYKKIALLGHSLGAYACLSAYTPDVTTMVLLGALTGPVIWKWKDMVTPEQLLESRQTGYIKSDVNDGLRITVKMDEQLLNDIALIDQAKLLRPVTCPVFIIHGDADQQELDLLSFSKNALALLPKGSQLEIMKGVTHRFLEQKDDLIARIKKWFLTHFAI